MEEIEGQRKSEALLKASGSAIIGCRPHEKAKKSGADRFFFRTALTFIGQVMCGSYVSVAGAVMLMLSTFQMQYPVQKKP